MPTNGMTVVYALEEPPETYERSIFLAGPTPRKAGVVSWRPEAIRILRECMYDGVVFIPEDRPDENGVTTFHGNYDNQVEWEKRCLNMADVIIFWIPRELQDMPAFTTNDEWGAWKDSGKVVLGVPDNAVKCGYQKYYAEELKVPYETTLFDTVAQALVRTFPVSRTGGEREVPIHIWATPSFQQWYGALKAAGNELCHARVLWNFRVGVNRDYVFMWAMHVDIYVAAEDRHKHNEFVISRPDTSMIMGYRRGRSLDQTEIVLVREFRSPVSNPTGFVWEIAGGSSFKPGITPEVMAADEFHEETGLELAAQRFVFHEARQLNATVSAHRAHLFSVELTEDEIEAFKREEGVAHGVEGDSEQTYVEVLTLGEIRRGTFVDWSVLGMIMHVLLRPE